MRYARLPTDFWTWPNVQALTPHQRLIALYLWTGPHINPLGAFLLSTKKIADATGVSLRTCYRTLRRWRWDEGRQCHHGTNVALRSATGALIWLPRYIEWLPPDNPNMWTNAANTLSRLESAATPGCGLCRAVRHHFETVKLTVSPYIISPP